MRRNAALCLAIMMVFVVQCLAGSRSRRPRHKGRHGVHQAGGVRRPMPDLVPGEIWLSDGHVCAGVDNRGDLGGSGTFQCTLGVAGRGSVQSEGEPHPVPVAQGRTVMVFPESTVARIDPTLSGPFTVRVQVGVRESDSSNNQFVDRIGVGRR